MTKHHAFCAWYALPAHVTTPVSPAASPVANNIASGRYERSGRCFRSGQLDGFGSNRRAGQSYLQLNRFAEASRAVHAAGAPSIALWSEEGTIHTIDA